VQKACISPGGSANCSERPSARLLVSHRNQLQVTGQQITAAYAWCVAPALLGSTCMILTEINDMTLNIRPLGDRILVEAVEAKVEKKGGIVIPDIAKEKPMECRVVALGTGKTDDNGKKVPFEMKKGDRLLVAKYGGTEVNLEGKDYRIFNSEDVLAIVE
jgi:chaperonin GroES